MSVRPGADPFSHDGSGTGVLLVHGFTGSPIGMRAWAEHVAGAGYTVRLPRLPGHGTTWQEMNRTRWEDWYAEVERSFDELSAACERVVVGGLSMGGALSTLLAERRGEQVAGLVLVNPAVKVEDVRLKALPVLKALLPSLPGIANDIKKPGQDEGAYDRIPLKALHSQVGAWPQLIEDLPSVNQPVLLFRSATDHVVPASSSALLLSRISSTDVTEIVLEESFHVATIDNDAPRIFEETVRFVERVTA